MLYQPQNLSKRERIRQGRTLVAAYHFTHTTRDGTVIARLTGIGALSLHKISQSDEWIPAIRFWTPKYNKTGAIGGEFYHCQIEQARLKQRIKQKVKREFAKAKSLWEQLFGISPVTSLERYLYYLDNYDGQIIDVDTE